MTSYAVGSQQAVQAVNPPRVGPVVAPAYWALPPHAVDWDPKPPPGSEDKLLCCEVESKSMTGGHPQPVTGAFTTQTKKLCFMYWVSGVCQEVGVD